MAGDLPAGSHTAALVGAWWPQPSSMLHAAAKHWILQRQQQEQYAQDLYSQWTKLASQNQGRTVDDLVSRFQRGEKRHLDFAEKYKAKVDAFDKAADAIDNLREGLRGIAHDYNQRINSIERSKESPIVKAGAIEKLVAEANGFAAHKSGAAVAAIVDATQKILIAEGIAASPQEFLGTQGTSTGPGKQPAVGRRGFSDGKPGGGVHGISSVGGDVMVPEVHLGTSVSPHVGAASYRNAEGSSGGSGGASFGAPAGAVHVPGGAVTNSPLSGVPGTPLPPEIPGQGMSPNLLGQSFVSGMATGQPAGAGAQSLSSGAMQAMESASPEPPLVPPPVATSPAISVPMAGGGSIGGLTGPMDASAATPAPAPSTGVGSVSVAPAVMTGGSWSAPAGPVVGGPATPTGPLPAYGSDLRPPAVASPAVSSVSATPLSGAPVAPSVPSSQSAGGALVSQVNRAASGSPAGQATASSSTMVSASAISATTGATAGAVSARAAEQQRLQRLVDAVARQEPRLSWAAGLRDDSITSLLVTDLAAGWIPPHVRLPAHVTLLEPAVRRQGANVVELLGAVVAAAAHQPNAYVAEADLDAPALTGDRAARSAAPMVDDFGPTLVEAVRRRDGLPRIAQAVAAPAVRKTGVLENEATLLRACVIETQRAVLNAYPGHDPAAVADWMLLAAIEAVVDEHHYIANYHLAWFAAITHRGSS